MNEYGIERTDLTTRSGNRLAPNAAKRLRESAKQHRISQMNAEQNRLTEAHVGRVISTIGEKAGIVVQKAGESTVHRLKYASAHDLRRGCAERLINAGVSAETLKVIFRHSSFSTTEKHYGASRSAQSAAKEVANKLTDAKNNALVGGLIGGIEKAPQLNAEELLKLKSLLNSL